MEPPVGMAAAPVVSETLYEHLELSHYIDTFRLSAERVRRLLFIIAVFSVVMLTAFWNTTPASWMHKREAGYQKMLNAALAKADPRQRDQEVRAQTNGQFTTFAQLDSRLHDYSTQRTEKLLFTSIPVIGVVFDVNDLGYFCGVAYTLLLPLLLFSLMREHEHLYLALFKVRQLHANPRDRKGGESRANYLYHALAMSQVLHAPPTLAQWRPSRLKKAIVPYVIFCFPIFIQGLIVYREWASLPNVYSLGAQRWHWYPQLFFIALNFLWCYLCSRYSMDFNHMWEGAFFHVNPAYSHVESRPLLRPLRRRRNIASLHIQRRLRSQAIDKLELDAQSNRTLKATLQLQIAGQVISNREIDEICDKFVREADGKGKIVSAEVTSSKLTGDLWVVQAIFQLHDATLPQRRYAMPMIFRGRRTVAILLPQGGRDRGSDDDDPDRAALTAPSTPPAAAATDGLNEAAIGGP